MSSHCRGCGQPVRWIETMAGEKMICDPDPVTANGDELGLILVLVNGVTISRPQAGVVGFKPHWGTCPKASEFKKKK